MKTLNTHVNYTIWEAPYQLSLPLNISFQIPDDDPVRLVKLLIKSEKEFLNNYIHSQGTRFFADWMPVCFVYLFLY